MRRNAGTGLWRYAAAAVGGLAAGAGAIHLLHQRGKGAVAVEAPGLSAEPEPAPGLHPQDYEAREPGRGRMASRPHHIPWKGWIDILYRAAGAYFGDRVGFVSGGVTFFMVLSLFPAFAAFISIYGLFADPYGAWERLAFLYSVLPAGVAEFMGQQMQRLAETSTGGLSFTLVWTLALSLWAANGGIKTLFHGLNIAYHEVEKRNIVRYNLVCLVFTLGGLFAVLLAAALVVGVPVALGLIGLEGRWADLAPLRWPLLLVAYVGALVLVYRYGPCRARARWRWLTVGALVAGALSLALSAGFSWYLQTFVRADTYGPLAAVMGFLIWTWLSVQIILMGAELNAEIERQTVIDTTTGPPRPLGRRGAAVADTVGARRGTPAALAFTQRHAEALADKVRRRKRE